MFPRAPKRPGKSLNPPRGPHSAQRAATKCHRLFKSIKGVLRARLPGPFKRAFWYLRRVSPGAAWLLKAASPAAGLSRGPPTSSRKDQQDRPSQGAAGSSASDELGGDLEQAESQPRDTTGHMWSAWWKQLPRPEILLCARRAQRSGCWRQCPIQSEVATPLFPALWEDKCTQHHQLVFLGCRSKARAGLSVQLAARVQ